MVLDITPTLLASIAGALLSAAFAYVPGLTEWFEKQATERKRQIMFLALVLAAILVTANQCRAVVACYGDNWQVVLTAFVAAAVSNQTAYALVSNNSARAKAAAKK